MHIQWHTLLSLLTSHFIAHLGGQIGLGDLLVGEVLGHIPSPLSSFVPLHKLVILEREQKSIASERVSATHTCTIAEVTYMCMHVCVHTLLAREAPRHLTTCFLLLLSLLVRDITFIDTFLVVIFLQFSSFSDIAKISTFIQPAFKSFQPVHYKCHSFVYPPSRYLLLSIDIQISIQPAKGLHDFHGVHNAHSAHAFGVVAAQQVGQSH